MSAPRARTGARIVLAAVVVLAVEAIASLASSSVDGGLRALIRATARTSVGWFVLAFAASSLVALWPSAGSRWLLRHRRHLGLAMAVSHGGHLIAIVALALHDGAALWRSLAVTTVIGGGLGYVLLAAMAATSTDRAAAWLGRRAWRALHLTGMWTFWAIFTFTYVGRAGRDPVASIALAPLVVAAGLRAAAAVRRRRRLAGRAMLAAIVALAAGCARLGDPGLRPAGPAAAPAAGVDWAEAELAGAGGVALHVQRWRPVDATPRAVVVIHHGLADHGDRYAALAARLVREGFAVWALDMRGHGRSAGARIRVDRIDDMLDDLDVVMRHVRDAEPDLPVFLYGHSFGGLIACLYTIERQPALAGLVLAAPALAFDAPPVQAAAIRLFGAIAPDLAVLPPEHGAFSHDRGVVAEMDGDPLITNRKGPARTARAVLDGAARVWAAPERLAVPLLAMHGTADRLTAPAGSRDLVARAGGDDRTLRLHDGLAHDLLREPDGAGARVTDELVAWLDAHAGGPPVTFASSAPAGALRGDARGRAMAVELDVRGEGGDARGLTGGLRLRAGLGRATALGLGAIGGLDVRGGALDGGVVEGDVHLGLALRSAGGAIVSITGGIGAGGVRGVTATHVPVELGVELPVGPVRLLGRAALGWRLGGDPYAGDARGLADEASALLGVRLGRDRRYWREVTAGAGPYLAVTVRDLGGTELVGIAVGLELWGSN